MKTKVETWNVQKLFDNIDQINSQPRYQRGAVWKDTKKSLLIDSMLRGIDVPKIYLNKKSNGAYKFEVADGQQRIDAIVKFKSDSLILRNDNLWGLDLNEIDGQMVGGLTYSELKKSLRTTFDDYELTVAIITEATQSEIRTLFGRLQLGETLKPAEKRNALISLVGNCIDSIALNHSFFNNSRIKEDRFNHQDYLAHVFALIAYDNSSDLKAELLEKLYLDKKIKWTQSKTKTITDILDIMAEIDGNSKKRIVNKFTFIDQFYLFYKELENYKKVDTKGFSLMYDQFEFERLSNYKESELLLKSGNKHDEDIYKYIMAYRYEGSKTSSIQTRYLIMKKVFGKYLK